MINNNSIAGTKLVMNFKYKNTSQNVNNCTLIVVVTGPGTKQFLFQRTDRGHQ